MIIAAKIAKEKSEDPGSAIKGGDLGFFPKGRMVPEFEKVAFSIKPNTLSEVVKSQYGYHIILVTDRKAAGQDPYEKVQTGYNTMRGAEEIPLKIVKYLLDKKFSLIYSIIIGFVIGSIFILIPVGASISNYVTGVVMMLFCFILSLKLTK